MWMYAINFFVAIGILSIVVTEITRSVVDRIRVRRDGIGGTQDIAIYGMIVGYLCTIGAIICVVGWMIQHFG